MNIAKIRAVFFSPTGNTEMVVRAICDQLSICLNQSDEFMNVTLPAARAQTCEFQKNDLVIAGMPVYAGRVPNKILPFLQQNLSGNGALVIPVVTFGNRSYDNALRELQYELEAHGFHTVAAAAVPAEHAFTAKLAPGRPDVADLLSVRNFAAAAADKIQKMKQSKAQPVTVRGEYPAPYYTPLGTDGQPAVFLKAKPVTDPEKCDGCGICAKVCPMGSVSAENPAEINGICIKCQACIRKCPKSAKYFDDPAFLSHVAMLEQNYRRRAEAEFFV